MSHFATVVVTTTQSQEQLAAALQPFHEFECTGVSDQYVIEVDETEKMKAQYETDSRRRYRAPDGTLHNPYENEFYRELTAAEIAEKGEGTFGHIEGVTTSARDWGDGRGYRAKAHFVPTLWTDVVVPVKDLMSFRDYIEDETSRAVLLPGEKPDLEDTHSSGYVQVDAQGEVVKVVDRTNPNATWDWWTIGGRYRGRLLAKSGFGVQGRPGSFGNESYHAGGCDALRKGDIDFEKMRRLNVEKHLEWVEAAYREMGDITRDEVKALCNEYAALFKVVMKPKFDAIDAGTWKGGSCWDMANEESPRFKELTDLLNPIYDSFRGPGIDRDQGDPWAWAESKPGLTALAFVGTDGVWRSKGKMGWFGTSTDKMDSNTWTQQFVEAVQAIPDDHVIWVVDCHI